MGQRVLWGDKARRRLSYAKGLCCHPRGPGGAGEMGWQEPHGVQQRELQNPAPGEEKP